jgi:ubiquinone/menaquinone biosynthesis C-methylase UbiE
MNIGFQSLLSRVTQFPIFTYRNIPSSFAQSYLPHINIAAMSIESAKALWENPEVAKQYKTAERWTSPPGRRLIEQSGLLSDKKDSVAILDNACGTGVITAALHEMMSKDAVENMKLTCSDLSPVMLEATKQRVATEGWKAETKVADAEV